MIRKILKWLGYLLLLLLFVIALFAAFNWTVVSNIFAVGGADVTDISKFQPSQPVKGCAPVAFQDDAAALPAASFAKMKAYSDSEAGIGLVVLVNGKVAGEAYRKGANAKTRVQSQSMHKAVVAMMVGAAIRDGVIPSADAPVGDYISEWKDDPRGKISFRHLLSMASGLHNASMSNMEIAAMNIMLGEASDAALGLEKELEPGTFNYSNGDYQVAGIALSRALKKAGKGSYADYLGRSLWCPLGNQDASLWQEFEGGEPRYFAFLDATARDWARVGEMIRLKGEWNGKEVIPAEWIAAMTAPSKGNPGFGMGIWRGTPWKKERRYSREVSLTAKHSVPYLADDVLLLDGYGGQRVYIVPSAGLVISRSGDPRQSWDDSQLVNIALEGLAAK
jgi:CubicO group peptidase (beta-lactamase class C family)